MRRRLLVACVCTMGLLASLCSFESGWIRSVSCATAQEAGGGATGSDKAQPQGGTVSHADVDAVFSKYHCTICHGGDSPAHGLALDSYKSLMRGGKRGPVIAVGAPENSELIKRLKGTSEPRMPFTGPPWVSESDIVVIERWIASGAPGQ